MPDTLNPNPFESASFSAVQRHVLRDALLEYITVRAGYLVFEPECDLAQAVEPYIRRRYLLQSDEFKDRKRESLIARVQAAMQMVRSL